MSSRSHSTKPPGCHWALLLLLPVAIATAQTEPTPELVTTPPKSTTNTPAPTPTPAPATKPAPATPSTPARSAPASTAPAPAAAAQTSAADSSPTAQDAAPMTASAAQGTADAPPANAAAGLSVPPPPGPATPSQNVTINLINRLVQRGVLTKEDAADLIQQAENDAKVAQEQAVATQQAVAQANATAQQAAANTPPAPEDDGSVRVTYVPDVVKTQISDQVKDQVMAQAKAEGWAAPKLIPWWLPRFTPYADVRVRYEGDFFPSGNDNTGAFPNFNAINTGQPFNTAGDQFSPQWNVDQNRNRLRISARLGADMLLTNGFSMGARIATGESNSPVTENQSMGLANQGQGGNFSKYAIWLDRAFIKYQLGADPNRNLMLSFGRFDNPFFTVSTIQWAADLGFDGVAGQAKYQVLPGVTPFINGGIFPVFNTDFNFSSNQPAKFKSEDKWLYAAQGGVNWNITKDLQLTGAFAYYYFQNVAGKLSSPYTPLTINDAGNTDDSRPSFAQKGNTYMALRDIVPNASNDFGTINQWQYYGLATPFQNVDFSGRLTYKHFEPFVISLSGEWIQNVAFNQGIMDGIAVNNRGPLDTSLSSSNSVGPFVGGNSAWIVALTFGSPVMRKFGDWNLSTDYRYVESDAVIDGFCDSDFGGGGTNLKGWTIGGNIALAENVWFGVRWMSANSIAGPQFKEDLIQFDLNAKF